MKWILGFMIVALCLLTTSCARAAEVNLEWSYTPEQEALLGAGGVFKLYQSDISLTYPGPPVAIIPASLRTFKLVGVAVGKHFWVITASDAAGTGESVWSNEVSGIPKADAPLFLKILDLK